MFFHIWWGSDRYALYCGFFAVLLRIILNYNLLSGRLGDPQHKIKSKLSNKQKYTPSPSNVLFMKLGETPVLEMICAYLYQPLRWLLLRSDSSFRGTTLAISCESPFLQCSGWSSWFAISSKFRIYTEYIYIYTYIYSYNYKVYIKIVIYSI